MMKRHHAQMQNTISNNAALGRCNVPAGAPSSMEGSSKGKQMEECSSSYGVERELASVGYAVKSSDLAQVAHRLEQLEMMLCTTQEDGISYLSEAVHYNPSDLAGWVENMLSELNGGPPPDASTFSQSCGTSSNNMNMNMSNMSMNMSRSFPLDHYDCGLGIYEAAAAAELGIDGSEFLFANPEPGSFMMGGGLDDLLVPPSDLMMESVIQSSSNSTLDDHQTPKHEEKQSQIHQQQMQYQVKQETVIKEDNLTPQTPKEEKAPRQQQQQQQQRQVDNAADEKMRERKKMKMQVKTEPVVPDRPMVLGPDDSQESGVRLVHTLIACAEAIQQEKLQLAGNMVKEIKIMASTQGGAMSKVARHFAEALARKIYGFLPQDTFLTQNDALSDNLHFHFYETCPYLKFAHFTANQAILEAFNGHKTVHVIDFSLKQGMQWPALMQALALRPGGPPVIRLTAIGPPQEDGSDNMQEVGMKLTELARTINVKFQFHRYVTTSLRDIKPWMLNVPGFDAVAVNSIMQLHRLLIDPSGIDELLGVIRSLNPKIVTVVEQEANHNKPVFLERFTEALHYYSTLFDSLEARGLPALSEEQVMSEIYLGREICNIVACDRDDRVERHEPLMLWRIRMIRAGFRAVHLGSNAFKQASMLLTLYPGGEGYRVEENNGCLTLGWHSRPLIAASAWQCT